MNDNGRIIRLGDALPCSMRSAGNESGICGRPATVAHAWPYTPRIPDPPTPGLWAMQPVCGQCAQEMAALYSAA